MSTPVPVAQTYGSLTYGQGPYGGYGFQAPMPPLADEPLRAKAPVHLLGVGPWTENVTWRAMINYGLVPSGTYPCLPLLSPPGITRMSFTLRRTEPSEAVVDTETSRGQAAVIEEMVTDLWWRRTDGCTDLTEDIGRFNAHTVNLTRDGDRLRTSTTFQDYRGVLEGRLVFTDPPPAGGSYPIGTNLVDIIAEVIPPNALIDLSILDTADLGVTSEVFAWEPGTPVTDVIQALQRGAAPIFDWDIELDSRAPRPVLRLWNGGRGTDRGVILHDVGEGYSPITSWNRRTNRSEYANQILYSGRNQSALVAQYGTDEMPFKLPTGVRDGVASDPDLLDQEWVERAARLELSRRNVRRSSWQLSLAPTFWQGRDHIDLGDPVRIVVRLGDEIIDEASTVEEISVEVDADGREQVTITTGFGRLSTSPASTNTPVGRIVKKLLKLGRRPPPP